MKKTESHRITTAGLLVAAGLILPYFTSHMFAIPGTLLLPMHIPILLCGLLCGAKYGLLCGIVVPILSSVLTGMPPAYPMLPIMTGQLMTLGLLSGLLHQRAKMNVYLSTLISMTAGWAVYGLIFSLLMFVGNGNLRALSVGGAITAGVPGMLIQMLLCPSLVFAIDRSTSRRKKGKEVATVLDSAREKIKSNKASCIVIKNDKIEYEVDGRGVMPLRKAYEEHPGLLEDAFVVDKIIGKAAAVIIILGGAKKAHGLIMSHAARDYLTEYGVEISFDVCVDIITGMDGTGICPIEKSVLDIADPKEAYQSMTERISELRRSAV